MPGLILPRRLGPLVSAIFGALLLAGCHKGGGGNPPSPVDLPAIACPADISRDVEQGPLAITYDPPVVSGGVAPVETLCSAASGSSFPGGTTDVTCTATDALQQKAQCLFHVAVNVIPKLQGTSFMAFGDSITWGEVSATAAFKVNDQDVLNNYPLVLQALLRDKYRLQAGDIAVANLGQSGEGVTAGATRLVEALQESVPDVLILLEGSNDANDNPLGDVDKTADLVVSTLRADVDQARRRGTKLVIWSTLLPEVDRRPNAAGVDRIPVVNDLIRAYESRTDAVLVDAFAAFDPQKELLIGPDGLHPTVAGYKKLAGLFLDAIAANFQEAAPPAASALFARPGAVTRPGPPASWRRPATAAAAPSGARTAARPSPRSR